MFQASAKDLKLNSAVYLIALQERKKVNLVVRRLYGDRDAGWSWL